MQRVAPHQLFGDFKVYTFTAQIQNTVTQVIPLNPDRFSFFPWVSANGIYYIAPTTAVQQASGWGVGPALPNHVFTFDELGPVVCMPWFAISPVLITFQWTEVMYQPRMDDLPCAAKISELERMQNLRSRIRELPPQLRKFAEHRLTVNSLPLAGIQREHYSVPPIINSLPEWVSK